MKSESWTFFFFFHDVLQGNSRNVKAVIQFCESSQIVENEANSSGPSNTVRAATWEWLTAMPAAQASRLCHHFNHSISACTNVTTSSTLVCLWAKRETSSLLLKPILKYRVTASSAQGILFNLEMSTLLSTFQLESAKLYFNIILDILTFFLKCIMKMHFWP